MYADSGAMGQGLLSTFLHIDKYCRHHTSGTDRYKRIKETLEDNFTEALSFYSFVTKEFKSFLILFQANKPIVHILYYAICNLMTGAMSKSIKKKMLPSDCAETINFYVTNSRDHKTFKFIGIDL